MIPTQGEVVAKTNVFKAFDERQSHLSQVHVANACVVTMYPKWNLMLYDLLGIYFECNPSPLSVQTK
jgi:hypothetical protein